MRDLLIAVVLGVVEGLTEFVPVSSTGHLIVAGHLLGFEGDKAATFEVFIQLGAILAVVVLYRQRIVRLFMLAPGRGASGRSGLVLLALTTFPALALGAAAHGFIKDHLFTPDTVAVGWGVGGVGLLLVERFRPRTTKVGLDSLRWPDALAVGLCQCLSLWPGVSRSAATIAGGMLVGVDRTTAAEYSFLAAIPVFAAATIYDLYESRDLLGVSDVPMFATGFVVSFVTAWAAVTWFLRVLAKTTLRPFGWYRIVATLLLVALSSRW